MRRTRPGSPEAAHELAEFCRRIEDSGLRNILADNAIMLLFLTLGQKMWQPAPPTPGGEPTDKE